MTFEIKEQVSAEQLSSLRESVGWNIVQHFCNIAYVIL